ncbi:ArsR family transcriptional regulator [Candidatus Woesearchaeota archaeon]|nr:ArsR family transcriptional regulator [Candidatus Woesearchaeota archaeon]
MIIHHQRITVVRHRKPAEPSVNERLQWLGNSLGLFSSRDKDKSCFRIFIELLKSGKEDIPLSSDELAERSSLTRGTVVHHLNNLMKAGIVVHEKNKYILRMNSLESLVAEIHKDIDRTLDDLKEVAKSIDKELNV